MDSAMRGKAVLITGASGGIGQAVARALSAEGACLVLHYYKNRKAVNSLCNELDTSAIPVQADLRQEQQVEAMYAAALGNFSQLDGIVVNAGVWNEQYRPIHQLGFEQWRDTITSDLDSAFLTCKAFMRHLSELPRESASIVLVGSTAALFGEAGHADYAAAKAGMVYGLTLSLKNEIVKLAPRGRVNCVCPGYTDTPMAARTIEGSQTLKRITATMALQKIATPEEIASAILFLSSERLAGHISGEILPVAGGMEGRLLHF